ATASLLVELLTEELPAKSLRVLGEAFAEQLVAEIVRHRLKDRVASKQQFATPRRLAVVIRDVRAEGLDSEHEVDGPVSSNSKAVEGFAKKHNIAPASLDRRQTPKGEIVVAHLKMPGVKLDAVLPSIVDKIVKKLPVSKIMRWGDGDAQFVRPVHGLVLMHGRHVVSGTVLGVPAGNTTNGHRFMGAASIRLPNADEYEAKLLTKFLVVSNLRVDDPRPIVGGNERVVRPRLEDARFFFNQDKKVRLDTRVPQLAKVVFHNKLGSQLERTERIKLLAGEIARALGVDTMVAERAAELCKADLLTGMVGEFPELQGVMRRYYALHDGEQRAVADAIAQHYRP